MEDLLVTDQSLKKNRKQQQQQKNNMQAIDVPKSPQFYIVTTNFFSKEMFLSNQ